jgi:hypothetical protein
MGGVAVALTGAALLCAGLLVAVADGQKKSGGKGGKVTVLSTEQQAILDAGAITVRVTGGKGKRVVVEGLAGGGAVRLTKPRRAKSGKQVSMRLSDTGRTALSGCSIEGLRGRFVKGKRKKGKKSARAPVTPLVRNLAACAGGGGGPAPGCTHPSIAMLPFPNDEFTVADPSTDTGRRLNFEAATMPRNSSGVPIDHTDFNHADGFSPGSSVIVHIPQVTTQAAFNQTGFVPITDEHRYADPNQAAVVINADTGERQPIFAELDALPAQFGGTPCDVNLIIRPLKNFEEGGHYIVALRDVKDASGADVPAPDPFRFYRDGVITTDPEIEARRPHMEQLFTDLANAAEPVPRDNLYLAWDFTVASEDSLAGRGLALRNAALDELGDSTPGDGVVDGDSPEFHINSVVDNSADPNNPVLRRIDGVLTDVPCYLHPDCLPGGRLQFQSSPNQDVPDTTPNGFADDPAADDPVGGPGVEFRCIIPRSTIEGGTLDPAESGLFGHGLLGNYTQVNGQSRLANMNNSIWCATSWAGFADQDVGPSVIPSLTDLSNFTKLTDRMLQGFVNFTYLGRALLMADEPGGFNEDPAFRIDPDGAGGPEPEGPAIDTDNLYFEGISQGAIMGGALTALSTDFTQSVLNVPGMNYSTLLSRSTDSAEYLEIPGLGLYSNYPNQAERQLIFALMQLLWDRGEANGYAQHMTDDPLPDTLPPGEQHNVLLQAAVGDFQVSNLTAEIEARTIGASLHTPAVDPGRHWDVNPFVDLPTIGTGGTDFPFGDDPGESATLVYYDGGPWPGWQNNAPANTPAGMECSNSDPVANPCEGTALAPITNTPPLTDGSFGQDSHSYPRRAADGLAHVVDWLQPSGFIDQCVDPGPVARPCYANGWTGP